MPPQEALPLLPQEALPPPHPYYDIRNIVEEIKGNPALIMVTVCVLRIYCIKLIPHRGKRKFFQIPTFS